jgi:hypothetical protein
LRGIYKLKELLKLKLGIQPCKFCIQPKRQLRLNTKLTRLDTKAEAEVYLLKLIPKVTIYYIEEIGI